MIVIATHNPQYYLPGLLRQLCFIDLRDCPVLVIDTGSSNADALPYLREVGQSKWPFKLIIDALPYVGYDTGAYQHAFKKFYAEKYLFIHDTVRVRDPNFLEKYFNFNSRSINCLWKFDFAIYNEDSHLTQLNFDTDAQGGWVTNFIPTNFIKPSQNYFGIFGPIFSCPRIFLEECFQNGFMNKYPQNKDQACGMERGWAMAAYNLGYEIEALDGNLPHNPALAYSSNTLIKVSNMVPSKYFVG